MKKTLLVQLVATLCAAFVAAAAQAADMNNSASMNVWLHKQVLVKLAENGGKVPPELLS
jgi:hypothetical protein